MKPKTKHINPQLLNRYAVHLFSPGEPDYDGKRVSDGDVERIAAHIASCKKCSKFFKQLQMLLREISQYLDEQSWPDVTVGRKKRKRINRKVRK